MRDRLVFFRSSALPTSVRDRGVGGQILSARPIKSTRSGRALGRGPLLCTVDRFTTCREATTSRGSVCASCQAVNGKLPSNRNLVNTVPRASAVPFQQFHSDDIARVRALLGESAAPGVDVFALRTKLGMTQRVFGAQFGVSRQQIQKWESSGVSPHRRQLDNSSRWQMS